VEIDWEHVALIVAAVLGTGGIGGFLGIRLQASKQSADTRRDNFEAMVATLQDEMRRLQEQARQDRERHEKAEAKADEVAKELAEHRGATDARINQLERDRERLSAEIAALADKVCPWGRVDCPRVARGIVSPGIGDQG